MIYHNTPLTSSLKSQMQTLQSKTTRSDLPMSNAAIQQLGLQSEDLRKAHTHEHMTTMVDKMLCSKKIQVSGGIQPLYQVYVKSQEAITLCCVPKIHL